jgi:hypothetical protein
MGFYGEDFDYGDEAYKGEPQIDPLKPEDKRHRQAMMATYPIKELYDEE